MSLTLRAPAARWFCQALPFSPTPKYKLQVHTTAHGQVSCCQNPVWSTHADRYYNMLHSVTPAKSTGILKWDTSLQCLRYVTEQMIHPGKKLCSRRQLSNRICCCQAKWQNKVLLFQYQREAYACVGGEQKQRSNRVLNIWIQALITSPSLAGQVSKHELGVVGM